MTDFLTNAKELFPYMQKLRRDFHMHPEIGFQEVRTANIVAEELTKFGFEVQTQVAVTGVTGLLKTDKPGPVVLLRFDMDALPIVEETGKEYASHNTGKMHACGHDSHTALGIAVSKLLSDQKEVFNGTVKFMFQPAEEGLGGAERMIKEGVLENPMPDYCLAMHVWNDMEIGNIVCHSGPLMASSEIFSLKITGKGGHGAMPQVTIDPVVTAAQIIQVWQTIITRNLDPLDSAVLSVTQVHTGDAFNVIPATAELRGTVRSFKPEVRQTIYKRMNEIASGISEAMGCQMELNFDEITPALINDEKITNVVLKTIKEIAPDLKNHPEYLTMGSEDMALIQEKVPGCYFFIGSANSEKGLNFSHHHPKFDIDESIMPIGAGIMAEATVRLLNGEI
jgi:amidohydrolase